VIFPSTKELNVWQSQLRDVLESTPSAMLSYGDPLKEALDGVVLLGNVYKVRAKELASEGNAKEAEAMRRQADQLSQSLQAQLSQRHDLLAYYYCSCAMSSMKEGRPEQARDFGRRMLAIASPKTIYPLNSLAWFLATSKNPANRDPSLAVDLAKKIIEIDPRREKAWQSLGWAEYHLGNWKSSIEALNRSCDLQQESKGGEAWQWFGISMAQWRLGNKEEARRQYERAVEWRETFQPGHPQLHRFQDEAAELLGLSKKRD